MVNRGQGLVVEITDGMNYNYRGNLFYSLAKVSVIHLAEAMAHDLKQHHITSIAVTPGFLRSEAPFYIGKGIAALASDKNVFQKTGQVLSSWGLAKEYGFTDIDGTQPDWGTYFDENV